MTAYLKSINTKYRTYYSFNDMIKTEVFDSNLLKIDKESYKNVGIFNIRYITKKQVDDYETIFILNHLYLIIGEVDGFIEEKNGGKYLVFHSTDENKELLKKIHRTLGWNQK